MAKKASTDLAMVLLGVLAWAVAAAFGLLGGSTATPAGGRTDPNFAAGGAAAGFAIAGGLCFLVAALATLHPAGREDKSVQ